MGNMRSGIVGALAACGLVFALSCDWQDLDGVPAGFADGVDNELLFESSGGDFGTATTAARSDHSHLDLVPQGAIVMWSGSLASVPSGWQLCNGTSGTPDLRDRFILGVQAAEEPGATGGSHSVTLSESQLPSHTHTVDPPATTTPADDGSHAHNIFVTGADDNNHTGGVEGVADADTPSFTAIRMTNKGISDGIHMHNLDIPQFASSATGSGASVDNRPAFYKLAFIMKL